MRKGSKMTKESRKKMSIAKKGKPGHKHTPETRKRLSEVNTGKRHSVATRLKISLIQRGQKRKPCSPETRRKISDAQKGPKARNWKGGVSSKNEILRKSVEYKLWRLSVFQRDNYSCIFCGYKSKGKRPSDIHSDHIKPFALFPELRFAIDNGRTLCIDCHKKTDTYGGNTK